LKIDAVKSLKPLVLSHRFAIHAHATDCRHKVMSLERVLGRALDHKRRDA